MSWLSKLGPPCFRNVTIVFPLRAKSLIAASVVLAAASYAVMWIEWTAQPNHCQIDGRLVYTERRHIALGISLGI